MYQVTNANVYIDGSNMIGTVKEMQLPNVEFTQAEHKALGMIGTVNYFAGIEAMEASITWSTILPDTIKTLGNPRKAVNLTLYSNLEVVDTGSGLTEEQKITTVIRGFIKGFPLGTYTPGEEASDVTTAMAIHYIKQTSAAGDAIEVDVFNNTFIVNGEDLLADYNGNIQFS